MLAKELREMMDGLEKRIDKKIDDRVNQTSKSENFFWVSAMSLIWISVLAVLISFFRQFFYPNS